jgi:hypothetical protein
VLLVDSYCCTERGGGWWQRDGLRKFVQRFVEIVPAFRWNVVLPSSGWATSSFKFNFKS